MRRASPLALFAALAVLAAACGSPAAAPEEPNELPEAGEVAEEQPAADDGDDQPGDEADADQDGPPQGTSSDDPGEGDAPEETDDAPEETDDGLEEADDGPEGTDDDGFFMREQADQFAEPAPAEAYSGFELVTDDSGAINVELPIEWADIDGSRLIIDEQDVGPALSASESLEDYESYWDVPGLFLAASRVLAASLNEETLLDSTQDAFADCRHGGREPYADAIYTGLFDIYENCGGEGEHATIALAAVPENRAFIIYLEVQVVTEADLEALDRIVDSFYADPSLF